MQPRVSVSVEAAAAAAPRTHTQAGKMFTNIDILHGAARGNTKIYVEKNEYQRRFYLAAWRGWAERHVKAHHSPLLQGDTTDNKSFRPVNGINAALNNITHQKRSKEQKKEIKANS